MTKRSWVRRGNVISGNTFERVKNTEGMSLGYPQVMGIYFDDMQAGYTVVGNKFIDVQVRFYISTCYIVSYVLYTHTQIHTHTGLRKV